MSVKFLKRLLLQSFRVFSMRGRGVRTAQLTHARCVDAISFCGESVGAMTKEKSLKSIDIKGFHGFY